MPASKLRLNPAELDRVAADQVRGTAATGQEGHVQVRPQPQIPLFLDGLEQRSHPACCEAEGMSP